MKRLNKTIYKCENCGQKIKKIARRDINIKRETVTIGKFLFTPMCVEKVIKYVSCPNCGNEIIVKTTIV